MRSRRWGSGRRIVRPCGALMGVLAELVIADLSEAQEIAASDEPSRRWQGFLFKGLDNIKLATVLLHLQGESPGKDSERLLDLIQPATPPTDNGPWVYALSQDQVGQLATVAAMDEVEFRKVAKAWGSTEEFNGWGEDEVADLLELVGDLAE